MSETTELTDEEIFEMFGGVASPIVLTREEEAYLEWYMAYVEREGHLP